jgi:DNA polymerase-3 subunit gamma/tau
MSYVVLARKWRPMSFDDLVGQEHVSRTLGNAIHSGRVAHAFLFTGVRGVGKTTAARILAKALNCMGTASEPRTGPTATPCLECPACREIALGTDVDVREIDGASYNGVDEVRKLQDSLPYRPSRDRFKIFIVDEVHMLSQSAWNAFLKTLEEPPPHVKFIFATTEVHKVPVTILSRVQRFDFKLIPTKLIADRLRHVLSVEGIASDDQALSILAREAAGSMRDAMSLLDQVIAWNDQKLDGESVSRVLGVASRQVLHDIASALVAGDAARCLAVVSDLANQGYDVAHVARDLLALLRDLVVAKVVKDPGDLLDLADLERKDVTELAARADADDLVRLHQGFSASFDDVVRSGQARAALEMLLVRLARRPPLVPIDDLVSRLVALEQRLGSPARSGPAAPAGPRGPGPSPSRAPERGTAGPPERPQGREARPAPAGPRAAVPEPSDEPPRAQRSPSAASPGPLPSAPASRPAPSTASSARPAPSPEPLQGDALGPWRSIVERVRSARPELAAFLHHAVVLELGPERLSLAFEPGSVFERAATAEDALALVRKAAREELGPAATVQIGAAPVGAAAVTVSALEMREREERQRRAMTRAKEHPRIAEAAEILGARLKEIRLPEE